MKANVTCLEAPTGSNQGLENAEELIWSLLDDDLPEAGILELGSLVREHISVREAYLNCVKLHIDLTNHFGKPVRNVTQRISTAVGPEENTMPLSMRAAR